MHSLLHASSNVLFQLFIGVVISNKLVCMYIRQIHNLGVKQSTEFSKLLVTDCRICATEFCICVKTAYKYKTLLVTVLCTALKFVHRYNGLGMWGYVFIVLSHARAGSYR